MTNYRKYAFAWMMIPLLAVLLTGCSVSKVSEATIRDSVTADMRTFQLADFGQTNQAAHTLGIDKITIESISEENGGQVVYAQILMSDQDLSAEAYYKMLFRKNGGEWRLDDYQEYKPGSVKVLARPDEAAVRAWYQEKYGPLDLVSRQENGESTIFRYRYQDPHQYVTITGEVEITVEAARQGRTLIWTVPNEKQLSKNCQWKAEESWCEYPSSTPETYGKNTFFTDSRYVYTVKKENGEYIYTVDRYKCKPGEKEVYDKSHSGTAKVYEDTDNPYLSCYNEYTFCSLEIHMDQIIVQGPGVYDQNIYPAGQ